MELVPVGELWYKVSVCYTLRYRQAKTKDDNSFRAVEEAHLADNRWANARPVLWITGALVGYIYKY